MALVDVDIEDYLDEVNTVYLIKELKARQKAGRMTKEDGQLIDKIEAAVPEWPEIKTVLDQQKQDWVIENWEKITP